MTIDDWINYFMKIVKDYKKQQRRRKFSKWTQAIVLDNQNECCNLCGMYYEMLEFDHIDGDKTNNSIENCQALCPNCHTRKTKMRKMGFSF